MQSLSVRALLSLFVLFLTPAVLAHDTVLSGTQTFASLDGSASDHDGVANGVFTVNDGNLTVNGVVNCNDDGASDSACAMAFSVSGNMAVNAGGALYAENRSGSGAGGAITLTVGGNLALSGNAIVSTASKSSSGANGGAITANVTGTVSVAAGSTIDSGSSNARGGTIAVAAGGLVTVNGNVISGPSRTILSTRLYGGPALDGGSANVIGGAISISSSTFAEPAIVISATANVVSQGADGGAGPVTLDGCGITVQGLVAALSRKDGVAKVSIRSGKDVLIDGRDLGATGVRMGRVRADAPSGTALNKGVDIFATETVDVHGPASGSLYVVTSLPGLHDSKSFGGLIRITSLTDAVNGSGNMIDDGHSASGDTGGTIEIAAEEDVNLNSATLRAVGDFNTNNPNRGGGAIRVRSYSGDVIWTNGLGEVRPVGSSSNLPLADQGSIVLTACGTVNTTGSSFPVMGTATSVFPETHTGGCSPGAPSLPAGVPPLITCNTPPIANDASVSTNEDTTVTITLSGTDADGDPLTFSIVSGPSHGTLGAIVPTGPTSATVNYSPAANYNGPDSFVYRADDGNGGTDDATVSITVVAVNDAPSFLAGPTVTVFEDSGAYSATWASSISAGPADEAGQTVTFTVTNSDNSLFSVQPAVSSNGTLTFTTAANKSGSATITIVAHDDGGTANGGVDTSASQTSSITITAVNDEPSFTAGGDVTVNEDSGAYSAAWASAISAGPGETQNLTFVVTNDRNSFFSVQPAVSPTGVLTFTLAANANGIANVSVFLKDDGGTANGGDDTSGTQPFVITINAVNDAPSFTGGGDVSVLEDSGAYSAAWASAISSGPANESTQTVGFTVTNSNTALFAVQPAIDANGVLTFTVAANAFGPATVTVTLSDNGGTANGGVDTAAPQTFTINIGAVNDAPSFTSGGNVTVNEDSGAYSASWATAISAGPNESGQTVTFVTSNDDNALFIMQPSINSAGVLTFTPALNAFGDATVTVYAQDNGGTANGGVNVSGSVTFVISVNGVNDGPTAVNDTWETEGNTELRVDHGASLTPYVGDTTPSARGVLDNDADIVEGDPVVVTAVVGCADTTAPFVCSITGGTLTLEANGSFIFQPSPGASSTSFQYTVTDQPSAGTPVSATGTVTLTVHDMIWYVNGAAPAGGNGTSASPFNSFASLDGSGDVDGAGDYIFVHTSAVNGSIALETQQKLWGEGVGLIIPRNLNGNGSPATIVPAGVRPTMTSVVDTVTVTGVGDVDVAGLNLVSTLGNGIDISSPAFAGAASATIRSNSITAGLEGIDVTSFNSVTTTLHIQGTSIVSGGNGLDITGGTGTVAFSYANGSITSTGGTGIFADGSSLDALYATNLQGVTVTGATAGNGIELLFVRFDAIPSTATFDVVSAGFTVGSSIDAVGGSGVIMSNTSGVVAFGSLVAHGSTNGVTILGTGLSVGNLTGMRVSSAGGAIRGAAGRGLSITNATIGSAGLTVTSIDSTNGANGIVLNNTGTSGVLSVLGTGAANSGGTITGSTGAGVDLTSTGNVSLKWMLISNTGGHGISGRQMSDATGGATSTFSLANSHVLSPGNADGESGLFFGNIANPGNNTGRIAVSNTVVEQFEERGMEVYNTTGSLIVDITGTLSGLTSSTTRFHDNHDAHGEQAVLVTAAGTSAVTFNVSGVHFNDIEAATLDARVDASTASMDINWIGNVSVNGGGPDNFPAGGGFQIVQDFGGAATYDIQGNTIRDISGDGIVIISDGPSTGRIGGPSAAQGNVISGTVLGDGIRIDSDQLPGGGNNYTVTILVQNNNIGNDATFPGIGDDGIQILHRDGTKTLNLTIEGNVIANTVSEALRHFSDADVSDGALLPKNFMRVVGNTFSNIGTPDAVFYQTQETAELCLHMAGNTFSGPNANIFLTRAGTGVLQITQSSVAALAAANSGSTASSSGTIQFNGACNNPPLPANP